MENNDMSLYNTFLAYKEKLIANVLEDLQKIDIDACIEKYKTGIPSNICFKEFERVLVIINEVAAELAFYEDNKKTFKFCKRQLKEYTVLTWLHIYHYIIKSSYINYDLTKVNYVNVKGLRKLVKFLQKELSPDNMFFGIIKQ